MVLSEQTRCMLCGVIKNEFKNYETENINYDFFYFCTYVVLSVV